MLLCAGVDVHKQNIYGQTALDLARGYEPIADAITIHIEMPKVLCIKKEERKKKKEKNMK
jgi:hypothetical protein